MVQIFLAGDMSFWSSSAAVGWQMFIVHTINCWTARLR